MVDVLEAQGVYRDSVAVNVDVDERAVEVLVAALSGLIAARQDLSVALTSFRDGAEVRSYASSSSQAVAAVTSTVGLSLLFTPWTAVAGAITLISGAGIGALTTGGEALAAKLNDDEIQKFMERDKQAEMCFQQAISGADHILDSGFITSWYTVRVKSLVWNPSASPCGEPSGEVLGLSHASWQASFSLTPETVELLRSRLQISINSLCSLSCGLAISRGREVQVEASPAKPIGFEDVDDGYTSMTTALADLLWKRKLLVDWLVNYVEHCDAAWLTAAGSKSAAALTTVTGIVLFFIPVTTVAGAVCLASGVGLGAVSTGGEALASSLSQGTLQALVDDDAKALARFQRQLHRALQGQCRADGGVFDPKTSAHMWELRGIESWARVWFRGPSDEAGSLYDRSSQKDVAQRLHQSLSNSLEQLADLDSFLRDSDSGVVGALAFGSPAAEELDIVADSAFATLHRALDEVIQKRASFIVQLQELVQSSAATRVVANSSKTVTAVASATGTVLFLYPPTLLAGLITIVASGVANGMINGTENIVNRQTMEKLQQCCDDDQNAELAFDRRLREVLQKREEEEESLSAQLVAVLGAWAGEAGRVLARHHPDVWDSDAVSQDMLLCLKGFYSPVDCVYSWAHESITAKSVQDICRDVIASQDKLLDLRRRLSDVALKSVPPVHNSIVQKDVELVSLPGTSELREVLKCLDELLQDVDVPTELPADELPGFLALTDDLIQKRTTLVSWLDDWHSAISANRLTRESSRVICILGTITGVVLTFVPATAIAGGIVTGSCGGTEAFLCGSRCLAMGAHERLLQQHVASDQAAQLQFDSRLRQVLCKKADGGPPSAAVKILETWLLGQSSGLKRTRGVRGVIGFGPGAALPLQSEESASLFRADLNNSLEDLKMLRKTLMESQPCQ
eukprot:TRINITY_DN13188_c0_g7_i1.p1 TRINITY_DN13188_c0_g7~~TRINITY_DN13188_c0_g7_i1.p1  ORF type:complete len:915 (-),score=157.37 TRINITY_DN13188_c0_g7_i1:76-2820(-)